jgi:hypothetical protein
MPLRQVRYVTGNNRRRMKASVKHLSFLLTYNSRQPAGSFLLPSQVTAIQTCIDVLDALLAAVRFV